jgi:hypothetical protein
MDINPYQAPLEQEREHTQAEWSSNRRKLLAIVVPFAIAATIGGLIGFGGTGGFDDPACLPFVCGSAFLWGFWGFVGSTLFRLFFFSR